MNNARRKEIVKAMEMIDDAAAIIEECASDEQGYWDEMPENLQESERGERAQQVADELYEMPDELRDVRERLEETM